MRAPIHFPLILTLALPLALGACGGREDEEQSSRTSGGRPSAGAPTGGNDDGDLDEDGGERFDVGGAEGTAGEVDATDDGCRNIDILFVIDNSGSMQDEQANLVASFPGFVAEIQGRLRGVDGYHVGVITSDAYAFNSPACRIDGALVTQTGGQNSSNSACGPFAEGGNYMTENDGLSSTFSCTAQVGTMGDGNERPMSALEAALASPTLTGPGGCNEGFLREDALLVIVIITDEEDDHEVDGCRQMPQPGSAGEPANWFNSVLEAKGVANNVVVLSLVGPAGPDPAQCPALDKCAGGIMGAEVATRIIEFTNFFKHGFVGRVCESSYTPFFTEAVSVIADACADFVPQG